MTDIACFLVSALERIRTLFSRPAILQITQLSEMRVYMFLTCFCICELGGIEDITAKEALLFSKRPEIPSLFE